MLHVDHLSYMPMQECIVYIILAHAPTKQERKSYDKMNDGWFDHKARSFIIVHSWNLGKIFCNQMSLKRLMEQSSLYLIWYTHLELTTLILDGWGRSSHVLLLWTAWSSSFMTLIQCKSLRVVLKVFDSNGMRSCTWEEVSDEVVRTM